MIILDIVYVNNYEIEKIFCKNFKMLIRKINVGDSNKNNRKLRNDIIYV